MSCCISNCPNNHANNPEKCSFHKFPKDNITREKWTRVVNRPQWTPHPRSYICSKHFDPKCFKTFPGLTRVLLFKGAVPTKHVPIILKSERPSYSFRDITPLPFSHSPVTLKTTSTQTNTNKNNNKLIKRFTNLKEKLKRKQNIIRNLKKRIARMSDQIVNLKDINETLEIKLT